MKKIISHLLHHANKNAKYSFLDSKIFYKKKKEILDKYGELIGYDLQKIEGKQCHSCQGTGEHMKYSWETGEYYDVDSCWNCFGGWYKRPQFNILKKIEMNGFVFHEPIKRLYSKESLNKYLAENDVELHQEEIQGYVNHNKPNRFYRRLFYLLYFPKEYFSSKKDLGRSSYNFNWWGLNGFLNNTIGIFRSSFVRNCIYRHLLEKRIDKFKFWNYEFQLSRNFNPNISPQEKDVLLF